MPNFKNRLESFVCLGEVLPKMLSDEDLFLCQQSNPWFTKENVVYAIDALAFLLKEKNLTKWTSGYPEIQTASSPHNIGVVTAGNIPLSGFHDFFCVLLSGNNFYAKISSKDDFLFAKIIDELLKINPELERTIFVSNNLLRNMSAYIATGSNNSAKYFSYYFRNVPSIIRKNRNSIAILKGDETSQELEKLADDVFLYFGLGCRSVTKLFVPQNYNFEALINAFGKYSHLFNHNKYCNNYDYFKSIFLVNSIDFIDTGFCMLQQSKNLSGGVSVINYEFYKSFSKLVDNLKSLKENIQCVVGPENNHIKTVPFGAAQQPRLEDYADGIDTLRFLLNLKA